jgi:ZIP family zinc transporter
MPPMSEPETLLLGFIAGGTIVLGLPAGRMRAPRPGLRQFLNALAAGILLFILWDVLTSAYRPLDSALAALRGGRGGMGSVLEYGGLYLLGVAVGLLTLVAYERWLHRRALPASPGPGAMTEGELAIPRGGLATWSPARRMALLIAVGIGLHNFGEGLAIGNSAAVGAIGLATVLVIGFALHNATEGFGVVAPVCAQGERPSWGFLLGLGLIAGGPTFLGTAVGRQLVSAQLSVVFLTLAAGSILYVVIQLLGVGHRAGRRELMFLGVLAGLLAGFVTDMLITAGGV